MKLLFKVRTSTWPSIATFVMLASITLLCFSLIEKHSGLVYLNESSCDSVASDILDNELQEEATDYMADSMEFSGCIYKSKGNAKALHKVLVFCRSQYKPPFMEKEQRPPQSSIV